MAERRENIRINVDGRDDASDDIDAASRSVRDLGEAADGADRDVDRLGDAADRAERDIDDLGDTTERAREKFDALKGGLAAIAGFLAFEFARETIAAAAQIGEVAAASNVSAEALGKYTVAAERAEVDLKGLGATMQGLAVSIDEAVRPTSAAAAAFEELGLKSEDLKKLDENARFETVISALQGVEDFTKRAELGTTLLGDKFGDIEPLILKASGSLEKYRNEAERTGKAITENQVKAAEKADAAFRELESVTSGLSDELIIGLTPALTEVLTAVSELFKFLEESGAMQGFADAVSSTVSGLRDAVGFLGDLGSALGIFIEDVVTGQRSIAEAAAGATKIFEQEREATIAAAEAAKELGEVGADAADKIAESFTDATESIDDSKSAIDDITASMSELGITSQAELDKTAENLKNLLEQAKANNVAIEDQRRIFIEFAAAQRAAFEFRSEKEKEQLENQLKQMEGALGLRDLAAEELERVKALGDELERARIEREKARAEAQRQNEEAQKAIELAEQEAEAKKEAAEAQEQSNDSQRESITLYTDAVRQAREFTERLKEVDAAQLNSLLQVKDLVRQVEELIIQGTTSENIFERLGGATLSNLRAALADVLGQVRAIDDATAAATARFEAMRLELENAQAAREAEAEGRLEEFRLQQQLEQRLNSIRSETEFTATQRAELERLAKRDHDAELARIEERARASRRADREREERAAERAAGDADRPPPANGTARREGGGGITINVSGGLVDKDFVEQKLIPQLNRFSQLTRQRDLV